MLAFTAEFQCMRYLSSLILEQLTASHYETLQVSILSIYEGLQKFGTHLLDIILTTSDCEMRVGAAE